MQTRGAIYHHKGMEFDDGGVADKYLILLNTPHKNESYLFVKTTSQKKYRPDTPGCIKKHLCFFIKAGATFFPKDTWVLLHKIYQMHPDKVDTNKDVKILEEELTHEVIKEIVNCLFKVSEKDISRKHKKLLRPPLEESLLKLQAKFSQNN